MSQSTPARSSPSTMSMETGYVSLDGAQLFTKSWIPATAPIALLLFIHGFCEYVDRYDHVFNNFAERGIKTFAWDQRGFGRSAIQKKNWGVTGGTDKALDDIDHFAKQVKEEAGNLNVPVFIFGHSMGGALALMYAASGPEKDILRGVVSQSPLLRLVKPPAKPILFLGGLASKILPNFQIYQPVPGKDISRDPEVAKAYDADPLVHGTGTLLGIYTMLTRGDDLVVHPPVLTMPLLMQQGTADSVTSVVATEEMFGKLPPGNEDRELKIWEGYYHELHNEPEALRNETIKYIADWIVKRCDSASPKAKL